MRAKETHMYTHDRYLLSLITEDTPKAPAKRETGHQARKSQSQEDKHDEKQSNAGVDSHRHDRQRKAPHRQQSVQGGGRVPREVAAAPRNTFETAAAFSRLAENISQRLASGRFGPSPETKDCCEIYVEDLNTTDIRGDRDSNRGKQGGRVIAGSESWPVLHTSA